MKDLKYTSTAIAAGDEIVTVTCYQLDESVRGEVDVHSSQET